MKEIETAFDGVYEIEESSLRTFLLRHLTDVTSNGDSIPCKISSSVKSNGTFLIVPWREVLKRGINAVSFLSFKIELDIKLFAASLDLNWTSILEKPIFLISAISFLVLALRSFPT